MCLKKVDFPNEVKLPACPTPTLGICTEDMIAPDANAISIIVYRWRFHIWSGDTSPWLLSKIRLETWL